MKIINALLSTSELLVVLFAMIFVPSNAFALFHFWDINEVYTNADGTFQFIELATTAGGQTNMGGRFVSANSDGNLITVTFPNSLVGPTVNTKLLLATSDLAATSGFPTPDLIIPSNFFDPNAASISINFANVDLFVFTAGDLPQDVNLSLAPDLSTPIASPTNFAGNSASSPFEDGVPDTDGDGIPDSEDNYPLLPFAPSEQLLRRSTDNRWFVYVLSFEDNANVVIETKGFANMSRNPAYQTVSRSDFDGDGIADVLVRDMVGTENGRWVMYTLVGPTVTSSGFVDLTRNADWQVAASDDFDGDGKADLLLRNTVDSRWLLYLLDSQTVMSQGMLAMSTDTTNTVIGTGDFNNDGRHDILLRRADGTWLMYQLDGLSIPAVSTPAMTTNTAFTVQSLADFNGDGNTDVLLRRNDGRWFMYTLDGSNITASGSLAMTENVAFSLMSDADFNDDGKADALLRRDDGRWFLYSLNGTTILNAGNLNMTRNPSFQIVSTDDFNGDGKADALLRRADGRWVLYGLDGIVPIILGQGAPDMTRNEAWVPQTIPPAPLDTTPPVINLLGNNPQEITTGTAYTELGATAMDNVDGDISGSVVIDSSAVNTSTAGSYSVTYDVTDSSGNMADTVIRTVTVEDPPDDPRDDRY